MTGSESSDEAGAGGETLDAARWVAAHGDALFSFALARLHVRTEAEDAVQETFLAALGARGRYRGEAGERAWLYGILRHKVVDRLRARGREAMLESDDGDDDFIDRCFDAAGRWHARPQRWARPDEEAEYGEFENTLASCLGDLPTTLETTFRLVEVDGLDTPSACKALSVQPTNLWVRLHRARLRLRECLERRWFGEEALRRKGK